MAGGAKERFKWAMAKVVASFVHCKSKVRHCVVCGCVPGRLLNWGKFSYCVAESGLVQVNH